MILEIVNYWSVLKTLSNVQDVAKRVNVFQPLTIFTKRFIFDVWQCSESGFRPDSISHSRFFSAVLYKQLHFDVSRINWQKSSVFNRKNNTLSKMFTCQSISNKQKTFFATANKWQVINRRDPCNFWQKK